MSDNFLPNKTTNYVTFSLNLFKITTIRRNKCVQVVRTIKYAYIFQCF